MVLAQSSNIAVQPFGLGEYVKQSNGNPNFIHICSREVSRKVRFFVETIVLKKFVESFNGSINELPNTCVLNPRIDYYGVIDCV